MLLMSINRRKTAIEQAVFLRSTLKNKAFTLYKSIKLLKDRFSTQFKIIIATPMPLLIWQASKMEKCKNCKDFSLMLEPHSKDTK